MASRPPLVKPPGNIVGACVRAYAAGGTSRNSRKWIIASRGRRMHVVALVARASDADADAGVAEVAAAAVQLAPRSTRNDDGVGSENARYNAANAAEA